MARRYIDFISAYCDRWCERCALTDRCSSFAVTAAIPMCDGDVTAAFELAVGQPAEPGQRAPQTLEEKMAAPIDVDEPSEKELAEIRRQLDERRARTKRHPLSEASLDYAVAVHRWLGARDPASRTSDAELSEALEIISWDCHLIAAKINRALSGRDTSPGGGFGGGAVQSDWSGPAKVALISLERSERAWRTVAGATNDESAGVLADLVATLLTNARAEFPNAMKFCRPGFDAAR